MDSPRTRIATLDDVPALLAMMEPFNQFEGNPWDPVAKERALRTLIGDHSLGVVAVLDTSSRPIGYFVVSWGYDLEWDGRDAFLTELFLVPEVRGRGLGKVALEAAEALSREYAARALHLMVREENAVARRLYAHHGYVCPPRIFLSKQL